MRILPLMRWFIGNPQFFPEKAAPHESFIGTQSFALSAKRCPSRRFTDAMRDIEIVEALDVTSSPHLFNILAIGFHLAKDHAVISAASFH